MSEEKKAPAVDNSVPYPEAPPVNHDDDSQEHYKGAKDPEQRSKKPATSGRRQ